MENLLVAMVSYDRGGEIPPPFSHTRSNVNFHHMFLVLFGVAHLNTTIDFCNDNAYKRTNEPRQAKNASVAMLYNDGFARC